MIGIQANMLRPYTVRMVPSCKPVDDKNSSQICSVVSVVAFFGGWKPLLMNKSAKCDNGVTYVGQKEMWITLRMWRHVYSVPFSDLNKLHLLPLAHPTFVDITSCIMQRSMPRDKDDVHPSGPHRWTRSSTADLSPENGCVYIFIYTHEYIHNLHNGFSRIFKNISIHLENHVSGTVCLIEDLSKVDFEVGKWLPAVQIIVKLSGLMTRLM